MKEKSRIDDHLAATILSADLKTIPSAFDAKELSDRVAKMRVARIRRQKLVATAASTCVVLAVTVGIVIKFSNSDSLTDERAVVTTIDQSEVGNLDTLIPVGADAASPTSIDQQLEELRQQQRQLKSFAEQWESRRKQQRLSSQTEIQARQLALQSTLCNSIDVPDLPSYGF